MSSKRMKFTAVKFESPFKIIKFEKDGFILELAKGVNAEHIRVYKAS